MNGTVEGYAGYKVGDKVKTHTLYGAGVYVFNQNNPSIHTENGFEVPQTPGVKLHHIMTVNLSAGTIDHVVNGVGDPADTTADRRAGVHRGLPSGTVAVAARRAGAPRPGPFACGQRSTDSTRVPSLARQSRAVPVRPVSSS